MRTSVHSPWVPGYIDVTQIVLVMLTKAGLFLDRLSIIPMDYSSALKRNELLIQSTNLENVMLSEKRQMPKVMIMLI